MVSYKALNTLTKSIVANICHRIGYVNGCQGSAIFKSLIANPCYCIGNGCCLTSHNQGVVGFLYDGIAIIS